MSSGSRYFLATTLAALSFAGAPALSAMQAAFPDLTITKSHTGNFAVSVNGVPSGTYYVRVHTVADGTLSGPSAEVVVVVP